MGLYLNIGNKGFQSARKSEYVDKSGLIGVVNSTIGTKKRFSCITPRKNVDSPVLVIELKYDKTADAAIDQIKRKQYPDKVSQYAGELILVGINYDQQTKLHTCIIET